MVSFYLFSLLLRTYIYLLWWYRIGEPPLSLRIRSLFDLLDLLAPIFNLSLEVRDSERLLHPLNFYNICVQTILDEFAYLFFILSLGNA